MIYGAHPLRITFGKVVVYRDYMDSLVGKSVEGNRKCGDQCFSLAGPHLGDLVLMKDHAASQLNVVVPLAYGAFGGFTNGGEYLG